MLELIIALLLQLNILTTGNTESANKTAEATTTSAYSTQNTTSTTSTDTTPPSTGGTNYGGSGTWDTKD